MISIRTEIAKLLAIGIVAAGLGTAAAVAQETAPQAVPAPSAQEFEEPKLRSFVVAFLEVSKVNEQYQPQLQAAEDPEEQQRIRDEAGGKMVQAVEQTDGITVDEYSQIIATAQADPELAQKINVLVREVAGSGDSDSDTE